MTGVSCRSGFLVGNDRFFNSGFCCRVSGKLCNGKKKVSGIIIKLTQDFRSIYMSQMLNKNALN
jgi:hypothetical protein